MPSSTRAPARRRPTSNRNRKKSKYSLWIQGGFDIPFLVLVLVLLVIGLIMMFSASYSYAKFNMGSPYYYIIRQLIFAVIGLALMFFTSRLDYEALKVAAIPILVIAYILLIVVLVLPAQQGDFHRWINLGPFTFQPSEVAKFALVLFLAWHVDKNLAGIQNKSLYNASWAQNINRRHRDGKGGIHTNWYCAILYLVVILSMAFLVYKENHVSGAILIFLLGMVMMFLTGFDKKGFIVGVVIVFIAALIVINNPGILPEHAQPRIIAWKDKNYDPSGVRWQTNQALYAIGSGGFFGVGIGNSKMKQLYVSEPQNDFIFSIVCEELGFLGALIIVILFALLVWRGYVIGIHAKDEFGSLLCMGLISQVGIQAGLNIAVVTDMLPNTGISLPFFSYGGTAMIVLLFEMGIILSVSRSARLKKSK